MNKKIFIVTIISIVALIASVVFVSYAAYTANITGTKTQNLGSNGYVTMSCSETNFSTTGVAIGTKKSYTCALKYNVSGSMTIGYDIGLTNVSCTSGATCMINATKNSSSILSDTNVTSLSSTKGTYDTSVAYKIDSGTLSSNSTVTYVINAWISAVGANSTSSNTTGKCSDSSYTTQSACEKANEIWGTSQNQTQASATFSFKAKIGAKQINI